MRPTSLTRKENESIKEAAKYLEGKVGAYPRMLAIILADPDLAQISARIQEKSALTDKEASALVYKYCDGQKKYSRLCSRIADWGGLNSEFLFLDSLGTDVAAKIYCMNFNFLWDTETSLSLVNGEDRKKAGAAIAAEFLEMTESEFEAYKAKQSDIFSSI